MDDSISTSSTVADPEATSEARRAIVFAAIATLVVAIVGLRSIPLVHRFNLQYVSLFYEQFAKIEGPWIATVTLFVAATLWLIRRTTNRSLGSVEFEGPTLRLWPWAVGVSVVVLLIGVVGTDLIFHRYFLADDEYSAWFQAVIFAHGKWSATVPAEWCKWMGPLTPTSISVKNTCTWQLSYLPIHSMVRGLFIALHADRFAGPVMAALSVLLLGGIARRLWPDRPHRAWIAMGVLATSTQFLVMSMTMYAMPAHLLISLVWLWLYVVDKRWSVALLPLAGFIALGVHSPFPHLLLIPPFLFRYVREKRLGTIAYLAVMYAAGIVFWQAYLNALGGTTITAMSAATSAVSTAGGTFRLPGALGVFNMAMQTVLIATWNSPVVFICVLAAGLAWKRLDRFSRDAALSLMFILAARALMSPYIQGEGWGYRYIYAGLGSFALLAACGADVLARAIGARRAGALLLASFATSLLIELPLRGVQVEGIVHPYYRAYDYLSHLPARIVVFPADDFMWGRQLVRNDPFFQHGPLIMDMRVSTGHELPSQCAQSGAAHSAVLSEKLQTVCAIIRLALAFQPEREIQRLYPGQVRVVRAEELERVGLPRAPHQVIPLTLEQSGVSGAMLKLEETGKK